MFRRIPPAVLLLVLTASSGRGAEPVKYEPEGGNFSVLMPDKFAVTKNEIDIPGGKTTLTMATVEVGKSVAYMVMYNDYPAEVSRVKPEDILKGCSNGLKTKDRTLVAEKDVTLGEAKYPGKELQVFRGSTYLNARMYLVGTRLYQVMVIGPKDVVNEAASIAFLDSFAVK